VDPLSYLFGLEQFGIKFGLDNIAAIAARLGHPEREFATVHVAGTNGKGSVTAMVDAALRAAGHRTARYTSPHLIDLSERFVIDGRAVANDAMAAAIAHVRDAVEGLRADGTLDVQPTFFEVTTAVAFELFRRAGVRVAVLEVGLGGRLDATNIVQPIATAITSIAFDHQRYLGDTLREIAIEKAGIIKPRVPVVVGPMSPDAAEAIAEIAHQRDAPLIHAGEGDASGFEIGLAGAHQRANAAVALHVLRVIAAHGLDVPRAAVAEGLAHPAWPGRLDRRQLAGGRELLLDAAHNPAGAAALASYLENAAGGPRPLVFAVMRDKAIDEMLARLLPHISGFVATCASNPRSADPVELAARARRLAPALPVYVERVVEDALARAWEQSPRIVVAGSIFLLGDVLKAVGGT
jgi:dihydrofolate synthase/folylpolyglutamate synthase